MNFLSDPEAATELLSGLSEEPLAEVLLANNKRAEIAFKALSDLDEALDPDKPKPSAVLRRIVREAKLEIEKTFTCHVGW